MVLGTRSECEWTLAGAQGRDAARCGTTVGMGDVALARGGRDEWNGCDAERVCCGGDGDGSAWLGGEVRKGATHT